jgi:hypothetical protein
VGIRGAQPEALGIRSYPDRAFAGDPVPSPRRRPSPTTWPQSFGGTDEPALSEAQPSRMGRSVAVAGMDVGPVPDTLHATPTGGLVPPLRPIFYLLFPISSQFGVFLAFRCVLNGMGGRNDRPSRPFRPFRPSANGRKSTQKSPSFRAFPTFPPYNHGQKCFSFSHPYTDNVEWAIRHGPARGRPLRDHERPPRHFHSVIQENRMPSLIDSAGRSSIAR